MGYFNPRALYRDLLHDLSGQLPDDVIRALEHGRSYQAWPDITLKEISCLQLANSFLKKFQDGEISKTADDAALSKFLAVNERLATWSYTPVTSWDEYLVGELKQVVYEFFYPQGEPLINNYGDIFDRLRVGPGSSVGSPGTDLYTKLFSSRLSCTSGGLYRAYRSYVDYRPTWLNAELNRASHFGTVNIVEGNRLRFVPKNCDISRTIAVEPTLNMCAQLGIGSLLEDRLRSFFGIDISKQPDINRELCRRGSLDDSFCTIDLESASDSLSVNMLQEILPPNVLGWLSSCRSPICELPNGSRVKLNMISTMGNGYTFPLQTMLFASIVTAAARARGLPLGRPRAASDGTFGVFGDDIIIPTNAHYVDAFSRLSVRKGESEFVSYSDVLVRDVCRLLGLLGFVVNSSKSFFEGPFRESCGYDAFQGHNVRGVYIKTLRTTQSRFVAVNTLNRWSARTGIALVRTVRRLLTSIPMIGVPRWESDDAGVKVPFSLIRKYRRCKDVQSILYRKFVPKSKFIRIGDGEFLRKDMRIYNPDGLLLAFLNGSIRSGKISVRSGTVLYRNCLGVAPSWDLPEPVVELSSTGRRWESATSANLGSLRFEV